MPTKRMIVEKMYGKGVFYEDALNALIPDAYEEALKESQAKAVSRRTSRFSTRRASMFGAAMR